MDRVIEIFYLRFPFHIKEARETDYWIRLMFEVNLIEEATKNELLMEIKEIQRLLGAIRRTMKKKIK